MLLAGLAASLVPAAVGRPQATAQQAACGPGEGLTTVDAANVLDMIRNGEPVLLDKTCVTGDLSLSSKNVAAPLVITNSTITGQFQASFVVFESAVDFTGTKFTHAPQLAGSIFQGDAIFADAAFRTAVPVGAGSTDENISLERVTFQQKADLRRVSFFAPTSFADASFKSLALFQDADFERDTDFSGAAFSDAAIFVRAQFKGRAGFYRTTASGDLSMESAQVTAVTDLRESVVAKKLSLNSAIIRGRLFLDDLSAETLDLRSAQFSGNPSLSMNEVTVGSLLMPLDAINYVDADEANVEQISVLTAIERTYRDKGDLDTANAASYRQHEIEDNNRVGTSKALHLFFGRLIGGYAVRPGHPLAAALVLVAIGALVRLIDDRRYGVRRLHAALRPARKRPEGAAAEKKHQEARAPASSAQNDKRRHSKADWPWPARAADAFVRAAKVPLFPKPGELLRDEDHDRIGAYFVAGALLTEYMAQKALNVVFLVAIGNAIPGAKDFIDAIFPS